MGPVMNVFMRACPRLSSSRLTLAHLPSHLVLVAVSLRGSEDSFHGPVFRKFLDHFVYLLD